MLLTQNSHKKYNRRFCFIIKKNIAQDFVRINLVKLKVRVIGKVSISRWVLFMIFMITSLVSIITVAEF